MPTLESIPPFNKFDSLHLIFHGYDLASIFKPDGWRKYVLFFVVVSGLAWIFFGYEGTFDQIEWFGKYFYYYLLNQKTWSDVITITQYRYGIGTHLSAALIYGIMFYAISKYYETQNIKGSLNLTMSFLITAFSVSIFEFSWMASYYIAQQQFWVLIPLTKQASILYQNLAFLLGGLVFIFFVKASPNFRLRINKKLGILILLSSLLWALWYFYPFPQQQLHVNLTDITGETFSITPTFTSNIGWNGTFWNSYPNFPQTMYTINMNPQNPVGYGTPFFVEDNFVHTVNLIAKIVFAYTIFYFGKVKRIG